jgi:hypothetical protein
MYNPPTHDLTPNTTTTVLSPPAQFSWSDRLPWLLLLRAPAIALRPGCWTAAFVALVLMLVPEWLGLASTAPDGVYLSERANKEPTLIDPLGSSFIERAQQQVIMPWQTMLSGLQSWTWPKAALLTWRLGIAMLVGGVICRLAVIELTRGERLPLREALRFVAQRKGSLLAAPAIMLGLTLLVALPLGAWRWALASEWLAWPAAIGLPIAVLLALVAMLLGGVLVIAWTLLPAAIATEANDAFDAVSCTYAYVWQRPLRYAFYAALAFALGWVSGCVVELIGGAIEQLSFTNVESPQLARLIGFWFHAFAMLKSSFFWSYAFVSSTAVFLLLRRDVDEKQLDEVWR